MTTAKQKNKPRIYIANRVQKEVKLFALALLLYALTFLLIPLIYSGIVFPDWQFMNRVVETRNNQPSGFTVSFTASALQDILFFAVIGIYVWVRSNIRPEEKQLSEKVSYLFPTVNTDSDLKTFFQDKINKLGCISESTNIKISVEGYCKETKTFKVTIAMDITLHNLHHMDSFSDPHATLEFRSDLEEDPKDGVYGQILEIEARKLDESGELIYSHHNHGKPPFLIEDRHFTFPTQFTIDPYEKVRIESRFWLREPCHKNFTYTTTRYTKKLAIKIINMSGVDLNYELVESPSPREHYDEEPTKIAQHHEKYIDFYKVCSEESVMVKFDPI
ncbi:hypothetical protein [Marinobacter sp. NFXS9]|uniref:hypothetical protein n=1 Tax=Marinobacter sp. NFXS9 TaxID=2818433 RepID=UPI0032E04F4F